MKTCQCKAQLEAELTASTQSEDHWWKEVQAGRQLIKQLEAENAALRGRERRVFETALATGHTLGMMRIPWLGVEHRHEWDAYQRQPQKESK